ncbi:hypothetical protein ACFLVS_03295 [Chloroflexota bacterium]
MDSMDVREVEKLNEEIAYYRKKLEYLQQHCLDICEVFSNNAGYNGDNSAMLESVYKSLSWRVTKPLRLVGFSIKTILGSRLYGQIVEKMHGG